LRKADPIVCRTHTEPGTTGTEVELETGLGMASKFLLKPREHASASDELLKIADQCLYESKAAVVTL